MNQGNCVSLIGVGSPFGTDRIGWLAVKELECCGLANRFPLLALRFEQSDRPGSRLIGMLEDCDYAVIVDAMQSGAPAGTLRSFSLKQLSTDAGLISTHGFGVVEALSLAAQLGVLPSETTIIGIEVAVETEAAKLLDGVFASFEVAIDQVLSNLTATTLHTQE